MIYFLTVDSCGVVEEWHVWSSSRSHIYGRLGVRGYFFLASGEVKLLVEPFNTTGAPRATCRSLLTLSLSLSRRCQ